MYERATEFIAKTYDAVSKAIAYLAAKGYGEKQTEGAKADEEQNAYNRPVGQYGISSSNPESNVIGFLAQKQQIERESREPKKIKDSTLEERLAS